MSQLLSGLSADAVGTFITDFAEPITYTPFNGAAVTVGAVIERKPPGAIEGFRGAGAYKHEIWIANATPPAGVTAIIKGKDTVSFASVPGGTVASFVVMQVLESDQGVWHLAVG